MNEPHLHALRDVVDRQLFDAGTLMLGKVDDLTFDEHDERGARLTAVITGLGAFARRFEGRWRGVLEELALRTSERPEPTYIPIEIVDRTRTSIDARIAKDDIDAAQRVPVPAGPFAGLSVVRTQMRLSDVIGLQCIDRDGRPLGRVADAVLTTPSTTDAGPALVPAYLAGLVVGAGGIGDRLGYEVLHGPNSPPLLRVLMRFFSRHAAFVPWDIVERRDDRAAYLSAAGGELPSLEDMEHAARG